MSFLITALMSLLSGLPGAVGTFFKKQTELGQAQIELQKEIVKAQILQAGEMARAQLEYQTAALQATTPLFKQQMFWFLSAPILLSLIFPNYAVIMWNNVRLIPDFYWSLYSAVVLTVWGIPVASNMVSSVFNRFDEYATSKRADKIALEKVSSATYKKAFTDMWRMNNGTLTQADVEKIDKTIDALGEPPMKAK